MDKKLKFKEILPFEALKQRVCSLSTIPKTAEGLPSVAKAMAPPVTAFFVSFISAGASPALGVYPFGFALLSAASSLPLALSVLLGCIASSFSMGLFAVPFVTICLCLFAVRVGVGALTGGREARQNVRKTDQKVRDSPKAKKNDLFYASTLTRLWCALFAAVASGVYNILTGVNLWYDIFGLAFGCIITPLLCLGFSALTDRNVKPTLRKAGSAALCYGVVLAISTFTVGGMKISIVLAYIISLFIAYSCGITDGALFGLFCGMALEPVYTAIYPIGAVIAATLFPLSPGVALFCSGAISISFALYAGGMSAISAVFPEMILASLIFYPAVQFKLLPEKISFFTACGKAATSPASADFSTDKEKGVKERLERICESLSYMSNVFQNLSRRLRVPGNSETFSICEEAFLASCADCSKKTLCHQREGFGSGDVIRRFAKQLKENGSLSSLCVPDSILRGCPNIDTIISSVNKEYNRQFEENTKCDKTSVCADDYATIAKLIMDCVTAADLEHEKNDALTRALDACFSAEGITYEALSVYGKARPQAFVRGVTAKDLTFGTDDLKALAQKALGVSLCEPEMSMDFDKLNMYFECRRTYRVHHATHSLCAEACQVNGDVISSFYNADGTFYMLLCDGMGSGRDAALTARISSIFLERLLRAGAPVESALILLNNFTRERRIECFSTVDLLSVDLFNGNARFVKSGAAPSFVLRNGKLFRLENNSAPVGILRELSAKALDFKLSDGDTVIMLSDGVLQEEENEVTPWLYEMFEDGFVSTNKLCDTAKSIATAAKSHSIRADDTTVGIVQITKIQ